MYSHLRDLTGVLAILTALSWATPAGAQDAPPAPPIDDSAPQAARQPSSPYPSHIRPQADYHQKRRSIVHHYPYPYPGYYHNDESAGFRNPGGVGRYAEYYSPGETQTQLEREHVPAAPPVAQFDTNPAINRQEQMQATQIGVQRYNSIQNHIDRMAAPAWGYGFGVGGYGGFW